MADPRGPCCPGHEAVGLDAVTPEGDATSTGLPTRCGLISRIGEAFAHMVVRVLAQD